MPNETDTTTRRSERATTRRRSVLRAAVAAGVGLTAVTGTAIGRRGGGFPPRGTTDWGPDVRLGAGTARTFTTVTPSGVPKYHGVLLDRDALDGLPTAAALAADEDTYTDKYGQRGLATEIHHRWSLSFFVPFPATDATPFSFLGLNWNPNGHPPDPVWGVPHFDVHFHTLAPSTVDAIDGPRAATYDLPAEYLPEGYVRPPSPDERVITDMGEHLADPDAPEFGGGEFTNTLIWGAYDPDDDGVGALTFVEPMLIRAYLREHAGVDRRSIPQPDTYARPGPYPTAYAVRDVPSRDAIAVTVGAFESTEGPLDG